MPRQTSPLSIEYVLLGFLDQEPIHGYDLFKKLHSFEAIGLVWQIKQSQLYALLERLEAEGLVTSSIIPGDSHANRKQFHITSVGRQTFYAWRGSPVQHGRDIRMEFLAKLYFAINQDVQVTIDLIDEQHNHCLEWLADLQLSLEKTEESQEYERIVFGYRISQIQAILKWLEETKKEIAGKTGGN
jgi:DNA-binding PadR family transcriptional regulator